MSSSNLRALQENFQAYIMNDDETIIGQLTDLDRMSAKERADVYKEGYSLRLLEVMRKDFPGLQQFMGDDAFEKMGREYIAAYPSNHYNIVYFDRSFTQFLSTYEFAKPIHIEMAAFEWQLGQVIISEDGPQLSLDDLAAIAPEDWATMQLRFHPSARIIDLYCNAPAIWRAQYEETDIPEVSVDKKPTTWLIWRYDLRSFFVSLNEHQVWMYHAVKEGKNFCEICEGLSEWMSDEEVAQFAAFTLRDWFAEGVISEVCVG